MKVKAVRFPYLLDQQAHDDGVLPHLPLKLQLGKNSLEVAGLVDSGSSVNVLPHSAGLRLGAVWEQQTVSLDLGGNLASVEARGLLVTATIGTFSPVRLVFAWAKSDNVPLILGQINFFRAELIFEVRPRQS
jgi:hypothetical protein